MSTEQNARAFVDAIRMGYTVHAAAGKLYVKRGHKVVAICDNLEGLGRWVCDQQERRG